MSSPLVERLGMLIREEKIPARDVAFAADLVKASMTRRGLSAKQEMWVGRLVDRVEQPAPVSSQIVGDVAEIFALFVRASDAGLKWPKIHLQAEDGTSVQFSRAGDRSRYTGQIMVTDGMPFGANRYFGRIDQSGAFVSGRDVTQSVRTLIANFAADPAGIAALYGRKTGNCCFCHRDLSTDESLAVGYGPICADKFGLPWGEWEDRMREKAAFATREEEQERAAYTSKPDYQ